MKFEKNWNKLKRIVVQITIEYWKREFSVQVMEWIGAFEHWFNAVKVEQIIISLNEK